MASRMLIEPPQRKIACLLSNLGTALDKLCTDYENIVLLRDFHVEVEDKNVPEFMSVSLTNLVK